MAAPEEDQQQEQTRERAVPTFVVLHRAGGPSWNVIEDDVVASNKDQAIEQVAGDPLEEAAWGEWKAVPSRAWRGGVAYDEPQRVANRRKLS
jgi:hypothetical protein